MRLLILACSATKTSQPGAIPAIERYDGPFWRTLRAYVQPYGSQEDVAQARRLDVWVLSAKFGLMPAWTLIETYDLCLTPERANRIRAEQPGYQAFDDHTRTMTGTYGNYTHTLVAGGRLYQYLMPDPDEDDEIEKLGQFSRTWGGIGLQLSILKHWLRTTDK